MQSKRQLNVTLPTGLVQASKSMAADEGSTLSAFVASALGWRLEGHTAPARRPPAISLRPIVMVSDVRASVAFYRRLGFEIQSAGRQGVFVELTSEAGTLALHHAPELADPATTRVILSFAAVEPLEAICDRLRELGVDQPLTITKVSFGRILYVHDPDGLPIEIGEHDPEFFW